MQKPAPTAYPIHDFLRNRWSPRAFSSQPIETETLLSLFEAARWSPSGVNLQPWSFIVTFQSDPEPYARLLQTLSPNNLSWAKAAPVLVLTVVQREYEPGKPINSGLYDLGQSVAHLTFQASAQGISVHQMGGFDRPKARELFNLPEGYDPATVLALGYAGDPDQLPGEMRERELGPRTRKPLGDFVFNGAWKEPIVPSEPSIS